MSLRIIRCRTIRSGAITSIVATLAACSADSTGPTAPSARPTQVTSSLLAAERSIVVGWDEAMMVAVRASRTPPTVGARALAVLHTAMYDAWAPYDATAVGTEFGGTLRRPPAERTEANKREAVSFAAYRALVDLFPAFTATFAERMAALGYEPNNASIDVATPAGIGNVAAAAVLAARHQDGSNQLGNMRPGAYSDYTGYAPLNTSTVLNDPLRWQPLIINGAVQTFATPHWDRVSPFALRSASEFRPKKVKYQESPHAMRAAVEQVLEYSRNLDDRTKATAEYWADGPNTELPPGHWCLFATWVSERDQNTLDEDVKLFFAISNAVLDAGIAAWDAKRYFDSARPVTAVRYFMAGQVVRAWAGPGQGTTDIRGEAWQPYQPASVVTPPFSEFVSGHSTFSAAAAEVLRRFTGSDVFGARVEIPAGSSRIEPGLTPSRPVTLSWRTFTEAADEAGMSRRYGGIHFAEGDLEGRRMGRKIGALVWAKAERLFKGAL